MEAVAEPLSFDTIQEADLAAFHKQREKLLTAVCERIATSPSLAELASDEAKTRIAHESTKIFLENFYATAKYRLPGALLEYLDWLRGYLESRAFPGHFISDMLCALRNATHAFLEQFNSDDIAAVLYQLQQREKNLVREEKA